MPRDPHRAEPIVHVLYKGPSGTVTYGDHTLVLNKVEMMTESELELLRKLLPEHLFEVVA